MTFLRLAGVMLAFIMGMTWAPRSVTADIFQDAVMDYQFQDYRDSEKKLRQFLKHHPNHLMAHYYLGMVLQQTGKPKEAVRHLEMVKHLAKKSVIPGLNDALASAYMAAGMPEKALPILKMQYLNHPKEEATAFNYAKGLQSAGRYDAAKSLYRELIRKNGVYADPARFQLALIFYEEHAYVHAIKVLKQIKPNSPYGKAAHEYLKNLSPLVAPVHVYASSEWFYNDNPGSASSKRTGMTTAKTPGSQGLTQIASINTRSFELGERWRIKLGYLYYGNFFRQKKAKENDFVGHFINPAIGYQITPKLDIEIKGDFQFLYFGHQTLGHNTGATVTTKWTTTKGGNLAIHANFQTKKFTDHYLSSGTMTSLAYLDSRSFGVGAGGTWVHSGASLNWDYTYHMERPTHTSDADPVLAGRSRDSRYNEHHVTASISIPFPGKWKKIALTGNLDYSHKRYTNRQDTLLYPDAAGIRLTQVYRVMGVKIQVNDFARLGKISFNASLGLERDKSMSQASALAYKTNKYMLGIAGSF